MIVSITYFRVKRLWQVPVFVWHAVRSFNYVKKCKGLVSAETNNRGIYAFYTLTAWDSKEDMMNFIIAAPHKKAMLAGRAMEQESFALHYESVVIPSWEEALQKIKERPAC